METETLMLLFDLIHFSEGENRLFCSETKQDTAKNCSLGRSERSKVFLHKYRLLKLCVWVGGFESCLYVEGCETLYWALIKGYLIDHASFHIKPIFQRWAKHVKWLILSICSVGLYNSYADWSHQLVRSQKHRKQGCDKRERSQSPQRRWLLSTVSRTHNVSEIMFPSSYCTTGDDGQKWNT